MNYLKQEFQKMRMFSGFFIKMSLLLISLCLVYLIYLYFGKASSGAEALGLKP